MLTADLHIHTSASKDGESSVSDIIAAAKKVGLDLIAITDHDTMAALADIPVDSGDLLIIPGIEVSTRQGHLLILGINQPILPGKDILETIAEARSLGGTTILPHPFHRYRHGAGIRSKKVLYTVDAIEVFNSRYIFGQANRKAGRWAKKLKKPAVAGSDAHNARYVGYGLTLIDAEKNIPSVLEAIRLGKTSPVGRRTPVRAYTSQSLRNSWLKIRVRMNQ